MPPPEAFALFQSLFRKQDGLRSKVAKRNGQALTFATTHLFNRGRHHDDPVSIQERQSWIERALLKPCR